MSRLIVGITACVAAVLLAAAPGVSAQQADPRFYVGASLGQSSVDIDGGARTAQLTALGFRAASTSLDDSDTAGKLFAGVRVLRYFAIEGSYVDLGRTSFTSTVAPDGSLKVSTKVTGWGLDAVGILPIGERFGVFAKIGAFRAESKADYSAAGVLRLRNGTSDRKTTTDFKYGVGAEFAVLRNLAIRAEWERFQGLGNDRTGGERDADLVSIGIAFRF